MSKNMFEELSEKRKPVEEEYKKTLEEFAIHYVALWNALHSLGLNDKQTKHAIEIFNIGLKDKNEN